MKKKYFVYSYNMGINEYFDTLIEAYQYIDEAITKINTDKNDLIMCKVIDEI